MHDSKVDPASDRGVAAPALPKLARQHLHDTVVSHLRRMIVESVFPPGMKLNERELCETMGISRTPLREALKALAAEGLIEISPNRGASVYKMSQQEVWETFEFVGGLVFLMLLAAAVALGICWWLCGAKRTTTTTAAIELPASAVRPEDLFLAAPDFHGP